MIAENRGALFPGRRAFEPLGKPIAIENIIAQHQANVIVSDKFFPYDKRIRQSARLILHCVLDFHTQLRAVAKQLFKAMNIPRCGDDEHLANAGQHQRGHRIIHHRFVIYGQHLFGDRDGGRIQARARAPCQNNPFHLTQLLFLVFRIIQLLVLSAI